MYPQKFRILQILPNILKIREALRGQRAPRFWPSKPTGVKIKREQDCLHKKNKNKGFSPKQLRTQVYLSLYL